MSNKEPHIIGRQESKYLLLQVAIDIGFWYEGKGDEQNVILLILFFNLSELFLPSFLLIITFIN